MTSGPLVIKLNQDGQLKFDKVKISKAIDS